MKTYSDQNKLSFTFWIFFIWICVGHCKSFEVDNEEQEPTEEVENYMNQSPYSDMIDSRVVGNSLEGPGEIYMPSSSSSVSEQGGGQDEDDELGSESSSNKKWPGKLNGKMKSDKSRSPNQLSKNYGGMMTNEEDLQQLSPLGQSRNRLWPLTNNKFPQRMPRKGVSGGMSGRSKMQQRRLGRFYYRGEPEKRQRQSNSNSIIYRQCFFNPISCF